MKYITVLYMKPYLRLDLCFKIDDRHNIFLSYKTRRSTNKDFICGFVIPAVSPPRSSLLLAGEASGSAQSFPYIILIIPCSSLSPVSLLFTPLTCVIICICICI